eukprot:CAMPEP_0197490804 /NCGR_PEP_ID=MMETSP1311-20131121/5247_1 /TAXON_ID=464262 /ORGANISM="Genus nov. species nov., Strain RCC856" /LENGTH=208 /DNA_ID=CAMNT_0043035375 /DNA_START=77 /DNA_END=703 /DNA_ORIENTATION=+
MATTGLLARATRGCALRLGGTRAPASLAERTKLEQHSLPAPRVYSTTYAYECSGSGVGASAKVVFPGRKGAQPHEVTTDLPKKIGGKDEHPQPVEYLLAALIGCEVSTATFVARHMKPRFRLASIDFDYKAERNGGVPVSLPLDADLPGSPALQRVYGTATVRCAASSAETQARVDELRRHTQARCPVHRTLAGVRFETEWLLKEAEE